MVELGSETAPVSTSSASSPKPFAPNERLPKRRSEPPEPLPRSPHGASCGRRTPDPQGPRPTAHLDGENPQWSLVVAGRGDTGQHPSERRVGTGSSIGLGLVAGGGGPRHGSTMTCLGQNSVEPRKGGQVRCVSGKEDD